MYMYIWLLLCPFLVAVHTWYTLCKTLPHPSDSVECTWCLVEGDFEAWTDPCNDMYIPVVDEKYKNFEDIEPADIAVSLCLYT